MLTDVGQENPPERILVQRHRTGDLISFRAVLFEKHHMSPCGCSEVTCIIVGISRPSESIIRHFVPFFARYLASFASDADCWISEEANLYVFPHVIVPALIRALNSLADHRSSLIISFVTCYSRRFTLRAVTTRKFSTRWRARGRLFRMQICWLTSLRCVLLEPIEKSRTTRQASRDDVAEKRLAFHDRHIRFTGNGNQIIGSVTTQRTRRSEMKWNCDLMHGLSIQIHRSNAAANECARFNRAAEAQDANIIAVVDLQLRRQLWRHFDEHLWLQLGKMAQETRHPAAGMMFGQPISGENVRKARIARRCETVFVSCEPIHYRVRIA